MAEQAPAASGSPASTTDDGLTAMARTVLTLVNEARKPLGLRLLVPSPKLMQAAAEHANDMVRRGYFHFQGQNGGEDLEARVKRLGFSGRTAVALGRGTEDAEETTRHWLADSTTRPSLLEKDYRELGVGAFAGHWVLLVGQPDLVIDDKLRTRVRQLVNDERLSCRVPPLEEHPLLNHQAQVHCLDMAARSFFATINPDGKDENQRSITAGYEGKVRMLLSEIEDVDETVATWLKSAALRAAIIDSAMCAFGVGMFNGKWALLLGAMSEVKPKVDSELESDLVAAFNAQRSAAQLPPFRVVPTLKQAADGHTADMASKGFLAYDHPEARGIQGWLKEAGYKGRTFPAVTKGPTNAEAVLKIFLGSAGHKQQLLNGELRELGISVQKGYWTVILAAPQIEAGSAVREDFMKQLNSQRAAASSPAVELSLLLNAVAQLFAEDMVKRDFFAFSNPDGQTPDALVRKEGFAGSLAVALAKGVSSPEGALSAWLKNPQNQKNLLDAKFTRLGLGVAEGRWVLILGSP
ncbi:MAG: hypothetical protein JNJ46_21940 [Myxococcales bacterium]|nr:hypothetical protein [Myxococcales bacterium]